MVEVTQQSVSSVYANLKTSISGLTSKEATLRLSTNGKNVTATFKPTPWYVILFRQFRSFIIYVLLGAAVMSYIIGEPKEVFVIGAIVAFIVILSFFEEYRASREMEALRDLTPSKATVKRDGKFVVINAEDLVVGDIIRIERGNKIPADMRLISSSALKVDESALTGESAAVAKKESVLKKKVPLAEQSNMLFAGTTALSGHAEAIVIATGKNTQIGNISKMIASTTEEKTPLQKRLDVLGKQFSVAVLIICVLIVIVGSFRGQGLEQMLLLAVAVSVSGIPESLPAVIGVALALGMKRMAARKAVIKRLPAVETLGTCTVICTDKTGTLTQNKMVIENIFTHGSEITVTGKGFTPKGLFMRENKKIDPSKHKNLAKILEIGVLCNNADLAKKGKNWHVDGESTEGALVVLAKKAGVEKLRMHTKYPRLKEHPFDPVRKLMSTVHTVKKQVIVYTKGAPEILLNKASYYLANGKVKKLTKKDRDNFISQNAEYAARGLRVLGLAYKEHKGKTYELKHVENNLIFVGLVSIRDPPAENVHDAIATCKKAGIRVVMITGDNVTTGTAIAKELDIFQKGDRSLSGSDLDSMKDDELLRVVGNVSVFARATPKHKLRIVQALQEKGEIVAMTGDGVNDAPALKQADIGVAMGKRGTDVAKEAAEMVIEDDNFATIVTAVEEGRTIYSNIRKFLYYLLAGNFSEVILIFIAILIGVLPPLTPLMILFVNLVTSDIPALGLTVEKPAPGIMDQNPRNPKEGVLSDYLLLKLSQVIPLFVLGTIGLFMWELLVKGGTLQKAQTMAFAALIFFELFHTFNAKSFRESAFSKNLFNNIWMLLGVVASIFATIIVIYWPPAQSIFDTVPIGLAEWVPIIIVSSTSLLFIEIQKTIISSEIKEREKMNIHPTRSQQE